MWIATFVLIGLMIGLVIVMVAILAMPVDLHLKLRASPEIRFQVLAAVFGGHAPAVTVTDTRRKKQKPKKKPPKRKSKTRWRPQRDLIGGVPELISGLLSCIKIRRCRIDGDFGLGDPADTGHLYGLLSPFIYGNASTRKLDIALRPDFHRAGFEGEIDLNLRVTPICLMLPAARFGWRLYGPVR